MYNIMRQKSVPETSRKNTIRVGTYLKLTQLCRIGRIGQIEYVEGIRPFKSHDILICFERIV